MAATTRNLSFLGSLAAAFVLVGGVADGGVPEVSANPIAVLDNGTTDHLERASSGLYYGAAMGRGSLSVNCDDCRERPKLSEGLSLTAYAGIKLGQRFGVFGEYWMIRDRDRDGDWFDDADIHSITQQSVSLGAQLWLTRRLFLRASVGYGRHATDIDYSKPEGALFRLEPGAAPEAEKPEVRDGDGSSSSLASSAGIGFELVRTRTFGLSAEARVGRNRIDDKDRQVNSFAASIGLSWF